MLKAAWGQLVYAQVGASPEKLEKLRESVLALTKGWDQAEISAIVRDTLERRDRADRLRRGARAHPRAPARGATRCSSCPPHPRRSWRRSRSSSASTRPSPRAPSSTSTAATPVAPSATSTPTEKEVAILEVAERDGLDLDHSLGLLRLGHRHPDARGGRPPGGGEPRPRAGQASAKERGWPVEQFRLEVPLRDRVPMPAPKQAARGRRRGRAAAPPAVAGWWWWRRSGPAPAELRPRGPSWPRWRPGRRRR